METRGFVLENPIPALTKWTENFRRELFGGRNAERGAEKRTRPCRVSIIIPAHNEERYLGPTLEALAKQDYPWFEVIVVANGCSDRTVDVARQRCHRLLVLSQKSLGVARNLGARMAKGDLLIFLDADTTFGPDGLRKIVEEFRPGFTAGTCKGRPDMPKLRFKSIYWLKNFTHWSSFHHGSSGIILCWKKHFMEVGGFDEHLEVRENSHLIRRLERFGKYKYISNVEVTTSMRRYDQCGCGRIIWLWIKLWFHSWSGDLHHRRYEIVR